ncbi:MAG: DUF448 domain-containing protein [Pseudomonadota bacterium]
MSSHPIAERRCALTGQTAPKAELLRCALAPDGTLTPDLKQVLPGRGLYLSLGEAKLSEAHASGALLKAAARHYKCAPKKILVPDGFAERISALYVQATLRLMGLERKAGRAFLGADSVNKAGSAGKISVFINAADGAGDSHKFMARAKAADLPVITAFTRAQLSLAFGRENVVHAALAERGGWRNILKYTQSYVRYSAATPSDTDNAGASMLEGKGSL